MNPVPLLGLVRGGDLAAVVAHLDGDPRSLGTALTFVVRHGTPAMLREVLRRGPARDRLDAALAAAPRADVAEALVAAGAAPTATALRDAAATGNAAGVRFLLASGIPPVPDAVWAAARDGQAGTLRLLLDAGGDPGAVPVDEWAAREGAALHLAVRGGHAEAVRVLLEAGADAEVPAPDGYRPVDLTADAGIVAALHRHGGRATDPDALDLVEAARRGHGDRVAALLPGASPQDRGAALGVAVAGGGTDLATAILAYPVDGAGLAGALGQAIAFGVRDVVAPLIAAGTDLDAAANLYDAPPLVLAAARGQAGIVRLLLDAGADPGARDAEGATALETARHHDRRAVVRLLRGAPATTPAARRAAVRAVLERRDTWRPVLSSGDTGEASRFGGSPWLRPGESPPTCGSCGGAAALLAQLDLAALPKAVRRSGILQVFRCPACPTAGGTGPVRIGHDLAPAGAGEHFAARWVARWHRPVGDYPRNEGAAVDPAGSLAAQELNRAETKVGGWPTWIQDPAYPPCPAGGHPMTDLLLQLDSGPYSWGDNGLAYILSCREHPAEVTLVWQSG